MDENENGRRARKSVSRDRRSADALVVHGTAVSWSGRGVLIIGASGAGKSGLALRLIALGASLVSDDRVLLRQFEDDLVATAPRPLVGLVEARGVGLLRVAAVGSTAIVLVVDLDRAPDARMPERRKIALLGRDIDLLYGHGVRNLDAIITVIAQVGADVI